MNIDIDYKEDDEGFTKFNVEIQLEKEEIIQEEEEEKEVIHNVINDYDVFDYLKDWKNHVDIIDDIFLNIRDYFSKDGGISFCFIEKNEIFSILFQIMIESIKESPAHFNSALDIIDQIIFHTPDAIDYFYSDDFNIIDQIKQILIPFSDEKCIGFDAFIPEMFAEPAFNTSSIDLSLNIILNLCQANREINTLYKENFITILSNILRMKTKDNQIRDLQIIDCLYLILSKSTSNITFKSNDCNIILQAYFSVFERFREDQTCINCVAKVCKHLEELIKKEKLIVVIFHQQQFYEFIPMIFDFIFNTSIHIHAMRDIISFVYESLTIDMEGDGVGPKVNNSDYDINSILTDIGNIIGNENSIVTIYQYILNTTVERMSDKQNAKIPFSRDEERILSYLFDCLEQLVIIRDSLIIEYQKIEDLFSVINDFGTLELKISLNNFIIALFQVSDIDQLHQLLILGFVPDLLFNYVSSHPFEADLILDTVFDIIRRLSIENDDIINAIKDKENITDKEMILVSQIFPELLQSFLNYEDENRLKAILILDTYYKGI